MPVTTCRFGPSEFCAEPADSLLTFVMRIATWNVNSLKARLEKVSWWLERARPDVLLMQETKLADSVAPVVKYEAVRF